MTAMSGGMTATSEAAAVGAGSGKTPAEEAVEAVAAAVAANGGEGTAGDLDEAGSSCIQS